MTRIQRFAWDIELAEPASVVVNGTFPDTVVVVTYMRLTIWKIPVPSLDPRIFEYRAFSDALVVVSVCGSWEPRFRNKKEAETFIVHQ